MAKQKNGILSHIERSAAVVAVREDGKLLMVETVPECFRAYDVRDSCRSERQCDRRYQSVCCKGTRRGDWIWSENLSFCFHFERRLHFCDEFIDVYLARDLVKSTQHLDEGEAIDVEAHDVDELCEMIYAGKIQDSRRFLQSSPIRIC